MRQARKKYPKDFLEYANKNRFSHKDQITSGEICGCFYCKETFSPIEIHEWREESIAKGETAICPKCGFDTILGSNFPIQDQFFLNEMNALWF